MKHTPGPWEAKRTPASAYFDWTVIAPSGKGRVMQIGVDTDNTEGDARLIAAAPALLEALEACVKWADNLGEMVFSNGGWPAVEAMNAINAAARAAIKQATGEEA